MLKIEGNKLIVSTIKDHFDSEMRGVKRYILLYISEVGEALLERIWNECQYIEIHSNNDKYSFTRRMRTCLRYGEIIIISW